MLNTNTNLIPRVSLFPENKVDRTLQHEAKFAHKWHMYLNHSTTCIGKKEINSYMYINKQRITVPQQNALHPTDIYTVPWS